MIVHVLCVKMETKNRVARCWKMLGQLEKGHIFAKVLEKLKFHMYLTIPYCKVEKDPVSCQVD